MGAGATGDDGCRAELLLPAHGLPIAGSERINQVLTTIADVLEKLVADVIAAMNAGAVLDDILPTVSVDPACSPSRTCDPCTTSPSS